MAGVTQRTCSGCAATSRTSSAGLPLRYFDSHPHGDILSRVTNDIDNLTTTLQQGLSQLLTSVLTIVGVLGMMFWISPLLAAVSAVTIPLAIVVTFLIAKRSQVQFTAQWDQTGTLNGLVEETHTGHGLVQVFGRGKATIDEFASPEPSISMRRASGRSSSPGSSNRRCSSSPTSTMWRSPSSAATGWPRV